MRAKTKRKRNKNTKSSNNKKKSCDLECSGTSEYAARCNLEIGQGIIVLLGDPFHAFLVGRFCVRAPQENTGFFSLSGTPLECTLETFLPKTSSFLGEDMKLVEATLHSQAPLRGN